MNLHCRLVRYLFASLGSLLFAGPVHAEWINFLVDPPDDTFIYTDLPEGFTMSETHEGYARARAYIYAGIVFSNSGSATAYGYSERVHRWIPEPDCPTGRFSWNGLAEVIGRFDVLTTPATSSGRAYANAYCDGFGEASARGEGGSQPSPGGGASASIKTPAGGGSVGFPLSGNGGGGGFYELDYADGVTKCVPRAVVKKTTYAHVTTWAGSRWIPPSVGSADGEATAKADCEENELGGCCD